MFVKRSLKMFKCMAMFITFITVFSWTLEAYSTILGQQSALGEEGIVIARVAHSDEPAAIGFLTPDFNYTAAYWSERMSYDDYRAVEGSEHPALKELSFESSRICCEATDTVAYIGSREAEVAGKGRTVIAISFEGTHSDLNWLNSFDLGLPLLDTNKNNSAVNNSKHESLDRSLDDSMALWESGSGQERIHRGFSKCLDDFIATTETDRDSYVAGISSLKKVSLDTIMDEAKSRPGDYLFWISGHSLGAALAQLYSAYLLDQGVSPDDIITYTFAGPPVGNNTFTSQYKNKLHAYNLRNMDDPVAMLNIAELIQFYRTTHSDLLPLKAELASDYGSRLIASGVLTYLGNQGDFSPLEEGALSYKRRNDAGAYEETWYDRTNPFHTHDLSIYEWAIRNKKVAF